MPLDDINTYPECKRCGRCCSLNMLCMSEDDYRRIRRYIAEHDVRPIDYGKTRCCFQNPDSTCMIWEVRAQACRLHNCTLPRHDILEMNPSLHVDEDLWMVDLHEAFINGAMDEEEAQWGAWSCDGQTPAFLAATRMASLSDRIVQDILSCLQLRAGMRVLDVGCGSGEYCFRLGSHTQGVSFTGLDFDSGFVTFATERARGKVGYPFETPNLGNAYEFVQGDGAHLPFQDDVFDAVVSHTYLTAVPNWEASLKEMMRVCKPGGSVSSVTSLTDDFYGTGTIRLFGEDSESVLAELIERVDAVSARAFPEVNLIGGIEPREVPASFARTGLENVRCLPLGHYFCLSDAQLNETDYRRHVDLLRLIEEERLERLLANPAAKAQLPDADWQLFAELIGKRHSQLLSAWRENREWDWYGNASLLVYGTAPAT